jgi:alanine racemase
MRIIRLAPDAPDATLGLSKDEALTEANAAFQRARKAQTVLVSHLDLSERLGDPGMVNRAKLRGMQRQAEEQVERAQAVVAALFESAEALERYRDPKPGARA